MKKLIIVCTGLCFTNIHYLFSQVSMPQQSRLVKESNIICRDEKMMDSEWRSVLTETKDKKIVLLGEFTHGAKEIFTLRNQLIQALHQRYGFSIVLFESGIGELALPDIDREEMSATQMSYGFFSAWRTKEVEALMEYIRSSGMSIAGYDVQRTSGSFIKLLTRVALQKGLDTVLYKGIEERFGELQRAFSNASLVYDSVAPAADQLIAAYQVLRTAVKSNGHDSSKALLYSERTILNRIKYLEYMLQFIKDRDYKKRWAARDQAMADNIVWLSDTVFPDQKLIVVGHNYHIAKSNPQEQVMGALLKKRYANEMYSIGVFGGGGIHADNAGKAVTMSLPDKDSLDIKHIVNQLPGFATFINIPTRKKTRENWLHQSIIINDSFIDLKKSNRMVLAEQFDGLLLIRQLSLPER